MSSKSELLHEALKFVSSTDSVENLEAVTTSLEEIYQYFSDDSGDLTISDLEFTVLTLQNTFQTLSPSCSTLKCRILVIMTEITLIFFDSNATIANEMVDFYVKVLGDNVEATITLLICADCLIELELSNPGFLSRVWTKLEDILLFNGTLINKRAEIFGLIASYETETVNSEAAANHLLQELQKNTPYLAPSVIAQSLNSFKSKENSATNRSLVSISNDLQTQYSSTFDLCILQSVAALQENFKTVSNEMPTLMNVLTHPGLSVGHILLIMEWVNSNAKRLYHDGHTYNSENIDLKPFDGADVKLKKTIFSVLTSREDQVSNIERLMKHCLKNPSARSFAAVFRVFRVLLWFAQETNDCFPSFVISYIISLAKNHSACLPHIVDFVRYLNGTKWKNCSGKIILNLIDLFDELPSDHVSFGKLLLLFVEATSHQYQFCQPRVILKITKDYILHDGKNKILKDPKDGSGVLELCQSLIRNQDYEIFLPELKSLLLTLEELHCDEDVKHRAGMLRYLVSQVATNRLKDAFDVDLSGFGRVEELTHRLVRMDVLLNCTSERREPVRWSLGDKKSFKAVYLPVVLRLEQNDMTCSVAEVFGLRIDFTLDPQCGRVETIFVPYVKQGKERKACLILELAHYSPFNMCSRATMTTIDGRVLVQCLDEVHLNLEFLLSPIETDDSFSDLWNKLQSQSDTSCSSGFLLENSMAVQEQIERGNLQPFRYRSSANELSLATSDNMLILVKLLLCEKLWHAEILVEHPSLLSLAYYVITKYSKQ